MDKLVTYIEQRQKKYGHIKGCQGLSSNYYTFGDKVVRISDHMKYGEDYVNKFDYGFIIQPNDMYLFTLSPKNVPDRKMYIKIVTYDECREFIRKLHEFTIQFNRMNEMYKPVGWNCDESLPTASERLTWDEFEKRYIQDLPEQRRVNVFDIIERVQRGQVSKGGYDVKSARAEGHYNKLTQTQYDTMIVSVEKMLNLNVTE